VPQPATAHAAQFRKSNARAASEPRNLALDGFRGLMTIFVLVSHYFCEVPHGTAVFEVGWMAVIAFFVLSGFLVGRLIIEKQDRANFFAVFYIRRACRTLPIYFVCVILVFACLTLFARATWLDARIEFPLWSYLTFTQNVFIAKTGGFGAHWLAPTWTLAVEEQFYLLTPALFFIVPRRILPLTLVGGLVLAVAYRALAIETGFVPDVAVAVLLPGVADTLIVGLLAALLMKSGLVDWKRFDFAFRIAPLLLFCLAINLRSLDDHQHALLRIVVVPLIAIASALLIISLARGRPEAAYLSSRILCFFGRTSYSIYLTHLTVLGLMHGLILSGKPDVATPVQWIVTVAALPLAVLVGWIGTVVVEQPITAYGRSWHWSAHRRSQLRVEADMTGLASPA